MKRYVLIGFLMAALAAPGLAAADVQAAAGNITLLGHIDFVARYSAEDEDSNDPDYWPGYETYAVEHAVLGLAGQVGDNVNWVITHAFAFAGPYGAANALAAGNVQTTTLGTGAPISNDAIGQLLDARIDWMIMDSVTLSMGRFIPPTSMTWNPHLLKVLHTINYPLMNGSGLQALMIPMPMYQTGVMLTAKMGPASVMIGNFNGTDVVGGADLVAGGLGLLGVNNTLDIDKTKGTLGKLSVDTGGIHFGAWYYGEEASVSLATTTGAIAVKSDGTIAQWGLELCYNSDMIIAQAQYLSTVLDFEDSAIKDDLIQDGWYALLGANVGPVQLVARYDYFDYDDEKIITSNKTDEEAATMIGVNYPVNENASLGLNYTWRDIEDWDSNQNELAAIMEVNLF